MKRITCILGVALAFALSAAPSIAELNQSGNILVSFDGGISPKALPREDVAPVAVKVESSFSSVDGSEPPPQLRKISVAINQAGRIYDKGLPTCKVRRIQPTTIAAARRICGPAIVGSGRVGVQVRLGNQAPFDFEGPLLVFNAKRSGGDRRLLAQVYGKKPPSAFVLAFKITKGPGTFGNVIETKLPGPAQRWAYVTHFEMKLRRTYTHAGEAHSFISAGCAAPEGFPGAVYSFARARFGFAGGESVETTLIRSCNVRK